MSKKNVKNRLKGSGMLVVILTSIAFSIYAMSTYAEQEHYGIMQNKYEKNIKKEYEKDIQNIEEFYNRVIEKNNFNKNQKFL